mmetsp:Transcript_15200/g.28850  ORF Transcript_15200/g.28850 Transcript_15200/m.28850 type:complete len:324 (-) Transcript_15200:153-1124(-)
MIHDDNKRIQFIRGLLYRAVDVLPFLLPLVLINLIDRRMFSNKHHDGNYVHNDRQGPWNFIMDPIFLIVTGASVLLLILTAGVLRMQTKFEGHDDDDDDSRQIEGEKEEPKITPSSIENMYGGATASYSPESREEQEEPKQSRRKISCIHESLQHEQQHHTPPPPSANVASNDNKRNNNKGLFSNDRMFTPETHAVYHCPAPGCAFQVYFLKRQLGRHKNMTVTAHNTTGDDGVRWPTVFVNQQVQMRSHYVAHHPEIPPCDWPIGFAYARTAKDMAPPVKYLKYAVAQAKASSPGKAQSSSSKRAVDSNADTQSSKRQKGSK